MVNENLKSEMENLFNKFGLAYEEKLEIWTMREDTTYLAFCQYNQNKKWTIMAGVYTEIVRRWEFEISTVEQAQNIIELWIHGDMTDLTPYMDK